MSDKSLVSKDTPVFIIQLDTDTFDNLQYYKREVERLNKMIKNHYKLFNEIKEKKQYIEVLEAFRKMMLLNCIIKNTFITPFTCKDMINRKECKFNNQCKPRKEFLSKII